MEDSEDVKKIDEAIEKHKVETEECDEIEYAEFIDFDDNPNDCDEIFESEDYDIPSCTIRANIAEINSYAPSQFLTENEKQVVHSCTDPLLKELLLLNRTKNIQLMQLYRKIKDLLIECRGNIEVNEKRINECNQTKKAISRVWRLGIPYFKTQDHFPCPRNADVQKKHENRELFFYEMIPSSRWVLKDMNRLTKAVVFYYKVRRESELEKEIKALEKDATKDCKKAEVMQELHNQLIRIRKDKTPSYPPVGCEEYLDWDRISKHFLSQRYSDRDCQIFWKTYLHPDINKSAWSTEENNKLKSIVSASGFQNWDHIAKQLGNNRTGFITCVHYYCTVSPTMINGRFSEDEDKLLCDLVSHYKQGEYIPWTKITHHFMGRTRGQLFYRYKYFLCCNERFRGKFTMAEDILILILVDRFGKKFSQCAEHFPNRSGVQIKSRYTTSLKGGLKRGSFTIEEDRLILDHVKENGTKNWEVLVPTLKRCGAQIRQRYCTLMAKQVGDSEVDLETAPRRQYAAFSSDSEFDYKRCVADKFKNIEKIPTIEDIQRLLDNSRKLQSTSLDHVKNDTETQNISRIHDRIMPSLTVDDLLTDYFRESVKSKFKRHLEFDYVRRAASTLTGILSVLQAELHLPKTYKNDAHLDAMDVKILDVLKEDKPITLNDECVMKRDSLHIERMIPPNSNTLIGMRNLLIRNEIYKTKGAHKRDEIRKGDAGKSVLWCITTHLSSQTKDVQNGMLTERSLFYKRFVSLFMFPAVLSLVAPSGPLCREPVEDTDSYKIMRTYVRKRKPVPQQNQNLPVQSGNELMKHPKEETNIIQKATYTNNSKINSASNEMIISTKQSTRGSNSSPNSRQAETAKESVVKLSIVEQMKKRISQTLRDLTLCPSKKTFFHSGTEINPDLYCRGRSSASPVVSDKVDRGAINISTVVKNGIQMNKDTIIVEQKGATIENSSNPKRKAEPAASVSTKTKKPKRAKVTVANVPKETTPNKNDIIIVNANDTSNPVQVNNCPNLADEKLVLKDVPRGHNKSINEDLCDVQLLDEVLKNELNSDDESFEF